MTSLSQVSPGFQSTRRDFLKDISLLAVSSAALLPDLSAEDAKSVVAETAFGKVRGVDNNGIKTFKAYPTEQTQGARTALCRPRNHPNGRAYAMLLRMDILLRSATHLLHLRQRALFWVTTCHPRARIALCLTFGRPPSAMAAGNAP